MFAVVLSHDATGHKKLSILLTTISSLICRSEADSLSCSCKETFEARRGVKAQYRLDFRIAQVAVDLYTFPISYLG